MAPKPRRDHHRRARGKPAQRRLQDDLKRHQLARELIPQVIEATDWFLDQFPRVAQRRVADRIVLLENLARDVFAWTALGAPRDENQLPVRGFAASCLLDTDPHEISWITLALSGVAGEVQNYLRTFSSEATALPAAGPDLESVSDAAGSVLEEVRAFAERLRAHQATSAEGLKVGKRLLGGAIALDPDLAPNGRIVNLTAFGAFGLLERTLPTDNPEDRLRLAVVLDEIANALPSLVEHAVAHLEDDNDEDDGDDLEDDGELEEDDSLEAALIALDGRLRETNEAGEGSDVAFQVAGTLLLHAVYALRRLSATFPAKVRAVAAGNALFSTPGDERRTGPFQVDDDKALLETAYSRAARLLEADLPAQPLVAEPVEASLSELDKLVGAMRDVADEELVEGLAGGLALIGGATQTLRVGLQLGHRDPDTQRRMAAALGALDFLVLADLPEVRASAAQTLRELAQSAHERTGTSPAPR